MEKGYTLNDINVDNFCKTLIPTILSWEEVGLNSIQDKMKIISDIEKGLIELNKLIKLKDDIKDINKLFLNIATKSINARKSLMGLIALEGYGGSFIKGKYRFINLKQDSLFTDVSLSKEDKEELIYMFEKSGLKRIILNPYIKDLKSYYIGIIYGISGSNSRKNTTGKIMEALCEEIISEFSFKNNCTYIRQACEKKIWSDFGVKVNCKGKKFDFVIKSKDKLYFVEVNYYATNGSKLKSCCQEYINSSNLIREQGHEFIWITDGHGWVRTRNNLTQAYNSIKNIINFNMIENKVLNLIIKT